MAIRPIYYAIIPYFTFIGDMEKAFIRRFNMVTLLIHSYNLHTNLKFVKSEFANEEDLKLFHASDFIQLMKCNSLCSENAGDLTYFHESDICQVNDSKLDEFGLTYDCDITPTTYQYCLAIAGASLKIAKMLNKYVILQLSNPTPNCAPVFINWSGGWHHAKRSSASGYCYINDIVIAITELKKVNKHVLYIDLDLHHGDGVEEAFYALRNDSVMTVSFHHFSPGFFPGTGNFELDGSFDNQFTNKYNINIPLKEGIDDVTYLDIFKRIVNLILLPYKSKKDTNSAIPSIKPFYVPDAIVMQCGADTLTSDPHAKFNLTNKGISACVGYITQICPTTPLIILGGGGYNFPDTARCWTQITADLCGVVLEPDIPEHIFFPWYGPSYELEISPGLKRDQNDSHDLSKMVTELEDRFFGSLEKFDGIQGTVG